MSNSQNQIVKILEDAERAIREVGANAFRSGDDGLVSTAQQVARSIRNILSEFSGESTTHAPASADKNLNPSVRPSDHSRTRPMRKKGGYPRYRIDGSTLIRTGWSKKGKREYAHKVSREIFTRVIEAMERARSARRKALISADQIFECTEVDGDSIPAYQGYVVIGYLKELGVLRQVGREGYEVPADVKQIANDAWEKSSKGGEGK